ncbi:hypothetical protein HNV27_20300, partial [Myxococcus xanthus]|nr:hypothetical protein [Myxococcus xanthus]
IKPPRPGAPAKAAWERAASDDVRLMLALGSPRLDADKALFLLRQVPRLEDPSLFVAVMDVLRGEALPQSSHVEARTVFRQKLETLAAANPRAMQIQLLLLLGDTTMVERVVGLQLVRGGAQEMGDEAGREQALARIDALEGAVALFRKASIDRWPLHALTEELIQASTRDEPAYLLSFTRVEAKQAAETQQP